MIHRIDNFVESNINPITNMPYDDTWIVYCLTDSTDYKTKVGSSIGGVYIVKTSKLHQNWKMSVCDFIEFQKSKEKNIILAISEDDLEEAQKYYKGHNYNEPFLRDNEPDILIHSTTFDNWISIKEDKCLKSWNALKKEKVIWEDKPIGHLLSDPADFNDYVMFSSGAVSSESVVLSKQHGKIIMDQDMEYKTGVRLYFDIKKIAEDGLLIRDGVHLKVKDMLPLEPYLLWYATWDNVGLKNNVSTPKEFTMKSNDLFNKLFEGKINTTF
jgi:hypothetical protein